MSINFKKFFVVIAALVITISGLSCVSVFAENKTNSPVGDINKDGKVDIADGALLQKITTKQVDSPSDIDTYADMNSDGTVDIKDVIVIQKYLAGIYKKLPVNNGTQSTNTTASSATQTIVTTPSTTSPYGIYDPTATDPDGWNNDIIKP
ncbi:MAG: dockerin type I repeat-containing protein [Oscillospiraceae bacterium]|nr:dockerin type I repeat-containing protein [Oscillospiraceae bacterium]